MYRKHYIRFFISSTFVDMEQERNWLSELFEKLQRDYEQCSDWQIEYVDLRWGISDQAGLDNRTMSICKAEVARCQALSPRPNFISLIGERYGWIPLPEMIPNNLGRLFAFGDDIFKKYYRRDFNNTSYQIIPSIFHFWNRKPRVDSGPWILQPFTDTGMDEEERLHQIVEPLAAGFKSMATAIRRFSASVAADLYSSATEQEVNYGVLHVEDSEQHVIGYVRVLTDVPEDEKEIYQPGKDLDRMNHLKAQLAEKVSKSNNIDVKLSFKEYQSKEYENFFKSEMEVHIRKVIDDEIKRTIQNEPSLLEHEKDLMEVFRSEQAKLFVGREEECELIRQFIFEDQHHTFLWIDGEEGVGKSSLLAHAYDMVCCRNHAKKDDEDHFNPYFYRCGQTELTKNAIGLAALMYNHIAECYSILCDDNYRLPDLETVLRTDEKDDDITRGLRYLFNRVNEEEAFPIVIFIDGVQFIDPETAGDFASFCWFAEQESHQLADDTSNYLYHFDSVKPVRVKIICTSALSYKNSWRDDIEGIVHLTLRPPTVSDAMKIVDAKLSVQQRTITDKQRQIVEKTLQEERKPTFLNVLSNHLARSVYSWTVLEPLPTDMNSLIVLSVDTLITQQHHDPYFVWLALSVISSFQGISDRDLVGVLSLDKRLRMMDESSSHHDKRIKGLPPIYWYRLSYDLRDLVVYGNTPYGEVNMPVYGFVRDAVLSHSAKIKVEDASLLKHAEELLFEYFSQRWESNNPYALYNMDQLTLKVRGIDAMLYLLYDMRFTSRVVGRFGEYISVVFNRFFDALSHSYDYLKKAELIRKYRFLELRNWLLQQRGCSWEQIMWLATASSERSVMKSCMFDYEESEGVFSNLLNDVMSQDAAVFLRPRYKEKPIAVSNDGRKLLYATPDDRTIRVFDTEKLVDIAHWVIEDGFDDMTVADDALERIAIHKSNGSIVILTAKKDKGIAVLNGCGQVEHLTISHQGDMVAYVSGQSVCLWNYKISTRLKRFDYEFDIETLLFSESGKTLWGIGLRELGKAVIINISTGINSRFHTSTFTRDEGRQSALLLAASDKEFIFRTIWVFHVSRVKDGYEYNDIPFFDRMPMHILALRTGRYDSNGHFLISGFGGLCVFDGYKMKAILNVPLLDWLSVDGHYGMNYNGDVYDLRKLSKNTFSLIQLEKDPWENRNFIRCVTPGPNSLSANATGNWLICSAGGAFDEMLSHVLSIEIRNNMSAYAQMFIPPYPKRFEWQYVSTASGVSPDGSLGAATSYDDNELFSVVLFDKNLQQTSFFETTPEKLGFSEWFCERDIIWNIWTEDSQYLIVIIAGCREEDLCTRILLFSRDCRLLRKHKIDVCIDLGYNFTISADNRYSLVWCDGFPIATIDMETGKYIPTRENALRQVCSKILSCSRSGKYVYASLKDNPRELHRLCTDTQEWIFVMNDVKNVVCTFNDDYVYLHTISNSIFLYDNRQNRVVQKMYAKVAGNMLVSTHNGLALCERFGQIKLLAPSPELGVNRVAFAQTVNHWHFETHQYDNPSVICPHCGKKLIKLPSNKERTVCDSCLGIVEICKPSFVL